MRDSLNLSPENYLRKLFSAMILSQIVGLLLFQGAYGQKNIPFVSSPLSEQGDLSVKMVEGINQFLLRETARLQKERTALWKPDFSSEKAFKISIEAQRKLLIHNLGIEEPRVMPDLEILSNNELKQFSVKAQGYSIFAVRWKAVEGLSSQGLLLTPNIKPRARIVMIPDADVTPEALAGMEHPEAQGFGAAQRLVKAGFEILILSLINRDYKYSGNPSLGLSTKQPHREWIYRQAYAIGRHVIGYELQKIFSAIDWFQSRNTAENNPALIGVAGHGEGGLLALYASAIDSRIASTLISGYFDARERLWKEPIYRNVFGLLKTFGDAELVVMAWPGTVVIENSPGPEVTVSNEGAAPGILTTPSPESANAELLRAKAMLPSSSDKLVFLGNQEGQTLKNFSLPALTSFAQGLNIKLPLNGYPLVTINKPKNWIDNEKRQEHLVREMSHHVQDILSICERTRNKDFWEPLKEGDTSSQKEFKERQRERFWQVLGKLPSPSIPFNVKARIYQQSEKWTSYEVTLDVFSPDVFASGILIVPKGIKEGERRPVVVCQHGLESTPSDVVTTDPADKSFHYYKGYATKLAERGYISFAPQNPYRGGDKFRTIQRKANPLGLTLFSVIISQQQRIVEWLQQLPFADPQRIAFYGLSYGGKTAMRVPAIVKEYALSICSADFNEWVRKVSTTENSFGYVYTGEYDMPEWDLGHTFNYAEMAALIAPRPFMVERGHFDGVGADEWVNYEFGKVRRHYDLLGLEKSVRIEHFPGPHSINGKGTFEFLDDHLRSVGSNK